MKDDIEVFQFTSDIFRKIEEANSINKLEEIIYENKLLNKNKIDDKNYPKIKFTINEKEIETLIQNRIFKDDFTFNENHNEKINDPLAKILYALAWKNGDLKKIKHIVKGIKESNSKNEVSEAIVFHQFGRNLSNKKEPIIDQHVIRAFAVFKSKKAKADIIKWRKISTINKKHNKLIREYKEWLISDKINEQLKKQPDYTYHIDKILFALGKAIKLKNKS